MFQLKSTKIVKWENPVKSSTKYNILGFMYKIQSVITFLNKIKLDQGETWNNKMQVYDYLKHSGFKGIIQSLATEVWVKHLKFSFLPTAFIPFHFTLVTRISLHVNTFILF